MAENDMEEEESFEELLKASSETPGPKLFPGERISGRVVKISKDTIFVDLGKKSEGFAGITEFLDKMETLRLKKGILLR